ncbi:hypothetical protein ACIGXM_22110 [Kitasatospora sp. NPDC052896]|uniref:hypothetical protein n=1 Tax=Kitasatospora sp. NPDC052896 TaxID=3364061 RepID=UPI0037C75779
MMNRAVVRRATTVTTSLLLAGAAALGVAGQATAATVPAAPVAAVSRAGATDDSTLRIGSLPLHRIPADHRAHEFSVFYDRGTQAPQALQILVLSPEHGPYLQADDVRLDWFNPATRHWEPQALESQTGTLYTPIPPIGNVLTDGGTTTARYRLTVQHTLPAGQQHLTVLPRSIHYVPGTPAAAPAAR